MVDRWIPHSLEHAGHRHEGRQVDYDAQARRYQDGRGAVENVETLAPWRGELAVYLAGVRGPVLDLGAGTGIWARALASWFGLDVVAMEPSTGMRSVAAQVGAPTRVRFVGGRAEAPPFRSATFAAAWLSTVLHHIDDLPACATALRRVLAEGAPVLIRNSFAGRVEEVELFRHFPAAANVAARWPTLDQVVATFGGAGFAHSRVMRVREEGRWPNLQHLREWAVAMREADSALVALSDEEFAQGLENIDAAIGRGEHPRPTGVDFVSFS